MCPVRTPRLRLPRRLAEDERMRPYVRWLDEETLGLVVEDAHRILSEVGVEVEFQPATDLLAGAGAEVGDDGRIRIPPTLVESALSTVVRSFDLFDREGECHTTIGGGSLAFDPGSAAIRVWDYEARTLKSSTLDDCVRFAKLTDALPALALQSTCVVPTEVPVELADRRRLQVALTHGKKPVVTGTFHSGSFDLMRRMLIAVRGSDAALRERPLAVFDCCPTSPLSWSELTCSALMGCAEHAIPAELISVPMAGATAPVTLVSTVAQHAAENLSGVVIHQLIGPGSPLVWGVCAAGFDMRTGSAPLGAMESMMINSACAQVGDHLGLPTHAYMALSDSKTPDYQAGFETGQGAVLAALTGIDIV
jgi:trimethylamine:corrinoid methyltransferase-like protein